MWIIFRNPKKTFVKLILPREVFDQALEGECVTAADEDSEEYFTGDKEMAGHLASFLRFISYIVCRR